MNMLPPGRPGVSRSAISAFTRASRAGFSARSRMLFERGSAMIVTRCCASAGTPPGAAAPCSPTSLISIVTRSMAEAYRSGTSTGSPAGGWSSEAMMRSMRFRLSA